MTYPVLSSKRGECAGAFHFTVAEPASTGLNAASHGLVRNSGLSAMLSVPLAIGPWSAALQPDRCALSFAFVAALMVRTAGLNEIFPAIVHSGPPVAATDCAAPAGRASTGTHADATTTTKRTRKRRIFDPPPRYPAPEP